MSDPIDIKALDEYLKGSSEISQRYRELDGADVPPELDRRVLEAARAAVASDGARPSRSWLRWSAPVALAASVVLGVAVVLESGVQKDAMVATPAPAAERKLDGAEPERASGSLQSREDKSYRQSVPQSPPAQEQIVPEEPVMIAPAEAYAPAAIAESAPAPASARPPSLAKAESQRASNTASEEVRVNSKALSLDDQSQVGARVTAVSSVIDAPSVTDSRAAQPAAEQPVPQLAGSVDAVAARKEVDRAEAQSDESSDVGEVSVTGARTRRATGRTAGPRNTISGAGALSSETRPADAAEQSDPEKWLEEIRELRRAGKTDAANREWQRFRKAFPDFNVAADDIAHKQR